MVRTFSLLTPQWFLGMAVLSWEAVNAEEQGPCLIHLRICPAMVAALDRNGRLVS